MEPDSPSPSFSASDSESSSLSLTARLCARTAEVFPRVERGVIALVCDGVCTPLARAACAGRRRRDNKGGAVDRAETAADDGVLSEGVDEETLFAMLCSLLEDIVLPPAPPVPAAPTASLDLLVWLFPTLERELLEDVLSFAGGAPADPAVPAVPADTPAGLSAPLVLAIDALLSITEDTGPVRPHGHPPAAGKPAAPAPASSLSSRSGSHTRALVPPEVPPAPPAPRSAGSWAAPTAAALSALPAGRLPFPDLGAKLCFDALCARFPEIDADVIVAVFADTGFSSARTEAFLAGAVEQPVPPPLPPRQQQQQAAPRRPSPPPTSAPSCDFDFLPTHTAHLALRTELYRRASLCFAIGDRRGADECLRRGRLERQLALQRRAEEAANLLRAVEAGADAGAVVVCTIDLHRHTVDSALGMLDATLARLDREYGREQESGLAAAESGWDDAHRPAPAGRPVSRARGRQRKRRQPRRPGVGAAGARRPSRLRIVRVVTGRGLHSRGGVPVIRTAVEDWLLCDDRVFALTHDEGSFVVRVGSPEALVRWFCVHQC